MSDTQGTEWVQVEDWATVADNAPVKLISNRLAMFGPTLWAQDDCLCIEGHIFRRSEGFTLFIEKPKVQLPTEPGHYLDRTGDHWRLFQTGDWRFPSDDRYDNRAIQFAPFTLLRPVAEVAAEVLAEVRAATNATAGCETREALDGVAAKWATS
jgi:hypothetical protein